MKPEEITAENYQEHQDYGLFVQAVKSAKAEILRSVIEKRPPKLTAVEWAAVLAYVDATLDDISEADKARFAS